METAIFDLLKMVLPAALVLYAVFMVVRTLLNKDFSEKMQLARLEMAKSALPIRLQAYERLAIFLERISPSSLMPRLNAPGMKARELQQLMVASIREEFAHNLSQQVYVSEALWEQVRHGQEQLVEMINLAAAELPEEATSLELAQQLAALVMQQQQEPTAPALSMLRAEAKQFL